MIFMRTSVRTVGSGERFSLNFTHKFIIDDVLRAMPDADVRGVNWSGVAWRGTRRRPTRCHASTPSLPARACVCLVVCVGLWLQFGLPNSLPIEPMHC